MYGRTFHSSRLDLRSRRPCKSLCVRRTCRWGKPGRNGVYDEGAFFRRYLWAIATTVSVIGWPVVLVLWLLANKISRHPPRYSALPQPRLWECLPGIPQRVQEQGKRVMIIGALLGALDTLLQLSAGPTTRRRRALAGCTTPRCRRTAAWMLGRRGPSSACSPTCRGSPQGKMPQGWR